MEELLNELELGPILEDPRKDRKKSQKKKNNKKKKEEKESMHMKKPNK